MTRLALLAILAIAFADSSDACSCVGVKDFWQLARESTTVVVAQVAAHEGKIESAGVPARFVVRVEEVLKGSESRKDLVFAAGAPGICVAPASAFPVGSTWTLVVPSTTAGEPLALSMCAPGWQQVATRPGEGSGRALPLLEIKRRLRAPR